MFPSPHRAKGSGPLLGARHEGDVGPFGVRLPEDDDPDGQPVPESTSAVDLAVQVRITAVQVRVQAAKERRESFAEARRHGLRRRHATKLARLTEQQRLDDQDA